MEDHSRPYERGSRDETKSLEGIDGAGRILLPQTGPAHSRPAAAGSDAGEDRAECGDGGGARHASGAGLVHDVVFDRRDCSAAESARHSDGELFCLSGADRALGALFPMGRETFSCAAFSDFRDADLFLVSRKYLAGDQIAVDHHLARDGRVGNDRAGVCWSGLHDSDAGTSEGGADAHATVEHTGLKTGFYKISRISS